MIPKPKIKNKAINAIVKCKGIPIKKNKKAKISKTSISIHIKYVII